MMKYFFCVKYQCFNVFNQMSGFDEFDFAQERIS